MGSGSHGVSGPFGGMSDVHLFAKADTRPPHKGFAPRALLEARPASSAAVLNHPAASGHLNGFARFAPWG